jgi:hypothetical protein
MPQMMPEGLPDRTSWSRYDFSQWADGKAWKFVRGEDYESSTESFRYNVKRWAKSHGFDAAVRTLPATDEGGRPLPASKSEPIGLGVCFTPLGAGEGRRGTSASSRTE